MTMRDIREYMSDEINGATVYIHKAINLKPMAKDWADKLVKMSANELEHAEYLMDMAKDYYKQMEEAYPIVPKNIQDEYDCIKHTYKDGKAHVLEMHEWYKG